MTPVPPAPIPVLLSTSSLFPESTSAAFELAASLGYDGVEIMVWSDVVSQDVGALQGLSVHYDIPVHVIHAPCLMVTQRVWSSDPWERLRRAAEAAEKLKASIVVVHPPFRWQRAYARTFTRGLAEMTRDHPGVRFAVENMYPVRAAGKLAVVPYSPGWDPTPEGHQAYTLDISHCATARVDCMAMADSMGDRLAHVHLSDSTGKGRDEHRVPGRGTQRCADLLRSLRARGFAGAVTVEVSTRQVADRTRREADLRESLSFAREHLNND